MKIFSFYWLQKHWIPLVFFSFIVFFFILVLFSPLFLFFILFYSYYFSFLIFIYQLLSYFFFYGWYMLVRPNRYNTYSRQNWTSSIVTQNKKLKSSLKRTWRRVKSTRVTVKCYAKIARHSEWPLTKKNILFFNDNL